LPKIHSPDDRLVAHRNYSIPELLSFRVTFMTYYTKFSLGFLSKITGMDELKQATRQFEAAITAARKNDFLLRGEPRLKREVQTSVERALEEIDAGHADRAEQWLQRAINAVALADSKARALGLEPPN
jgi:hypothetical protein